MHILLSVLIVTAAAGAATDKHGSSAVEIFRCDFGDDADANFDHWPDGWKRQRGPGHPPFTQIKIVDDSTSAGACLQIALDGGAAAILSPPIPVGPSFSYRLQCDVQGEGLGQNKARLSLTYLDAEHVALDTQYSQPPGHGSGWHRLQLGRCAPKSLRARYVIIGLHLGPGSRADLRGSALFDNISLSRASRISASLNRADHVYTNPSEPEVECTVSGAFVQPPRLRFKLIDIEGRMLAQAEQPVQAAVSNFAAGQQPDADGGAAFAGSGKWKPPIPGTGFYRVSVSLSGEEDSAHELSLAIVSPLRLPAQSEFGWSLAADLPLSFAELADVAPLAGIRWLKLPVWYDRGDLNRGDQLAALIDDLNARGIETVGLLANPGPELVKKLNSVRADAPRDSIDDSAAQAPSAAAVFTSAPDVWAESLEPVLTRLALRIHWWQLGSDGDRSFVGYPNVDASLGQVKKHIAEFGQEPRIGIGWRNPTGLADVLPNCDFVVVSGSDASGRPTRRQAAAAAVPKRWVLIDPLPREAAPLEARAGDLVHRLMKAKVEGADAIFAVAPFGAARGLMNGDGSAGELFLPWRTTAFTLGGTQHLGSNQLPYGSDNQVFARGGDAVMVVWNNQRTFEPMQLGGDLQQVDVWGRVQEPVVVEGSQRYRVGSLPTFVTGLNASAARWQIGLSLSKTRLPSLLGVPQETVIRFQNHFPHPVTGSLRVVGPDRWRVDPEEAAFTLGPGVATEIPLEITLPLDALSGSQVVRIDFDVSAGQRHQFSVYRQIEIGSDDVALSAIARIGGSGDLEIIQNLANRTDQPISFNCYLFAPLRKRQSSQIINHGRGEIARMYRLENAAELFGKTLWLRAEEVGGARVLNQRITLPESF